MLTYQLQPRYIHLRGDASIEFPAECVFIAKLGPSAQFGAVTGRTRSMIPQHENKITWDANIGKMWVESSPPLDPLDVTIKTPNTTLLVKGDRLTYTRECDGYEDVTGTLNALLYVFPALLSVKFPDPPVVMSLSGTIAGVPFTWEHKQALVPLPAHSTNSLEQLVARSFEWNELVMGTKNRRLTAAVHYYYVARRLSSAGVSAWEFMAESVLNMTKVMQILFGNSMDDVRRGLAAVGYLPEEIEGDFVPLMILRNHFDIGHPSMAIVRSSFVEVLYRYLATAEIHLGMLLERVIDKIREGSYELGQPSDLAPNADEQRRMDRLIETMNARLNKSSPQRQE